MTLSRQDVHSLAQVIAQMPCNSGDALLSASQPAGRAHHHGSPNNHDRATMNDCCSTSHASDNASCAFGIRRLGSKWRTRSYDRVLRLSEPRNGSKRLSVSRRNGDSERAPASKHAARSSTDAVPSQRALPGRSKKRDAYKHLYSDSQGSKEVDDVALVCESPRSPRHSLNSRFNPAPRSSELLHFAELVARGAFMDDTSSSGALTSCGQSSPCADNEWLPHTFPGDEDWASTAGRQQTKSSTGSRQPSKRTPNELRQSPKTVSSGSKQQVKTQSSGSRQLSKTLPDESGRQSKTSVKGCQEHREVHRHHKHGSSAAMHGGRHEADRKHDCHRGKSLTDRERNRRLSDLRHDRHRSASEDRHHRCRSESEERYHRCRSESYEDRRERRQSESEERHHCRRSVSDDRHHRRRNESEGRYHRQLSDSAGRDDRHRSESEDRKYRSESEHQRNRQLSDSAGRDDRHRSESEDRKYRSESEHQRNRQLSDSGGRDHRRRSDSEDRHYHLRRDSEVHHYQHNHLRRDSDGRHHRLRSESQDRRGHVRSDSYDSAHLWDADSETGVRGVPTPQASSHGSPARTSRVPSSARSPLHVARPRAKSVDLSRSYSFKPSLDLTKEKNEKLLGGGVTFRTVEERLEYMGQSYAKRRAKLLRLRDEEEQKAYGDGFRVANKSAWYCQVSRRAPLAVRTMEECEKKRENLEKARQEKADMEMEACVFRPDLCPRSRKMMSKQSIAAFEVRQAEWQKRKAEKLRDSADRRGEKEVFPFQPVISGKSRQISSKLARPPLESRRPRRTSAAEKSMASSGSAQAADGDLSTSRIGEDRGSVVASSIASGSLCRTGTGISASRSKLAKTPTKGPLSGRRRDRDSITARKPPCGMTPGGGRIREEPSRREEKREEKRVERSDGRRAGLPCEKREESFRTSDQGELNASFAFDVSDDEGPRTCPSPVNDVQYNDTSLAGILHVVENAGRDSQLF